MQLVLGRISSWLVRAGVLPASRLPLGRYDCQTDVTLPVRSKKHRHQPRHTWNMEHRPSHDLTAPTMTSASLNLPNQNQSCVTPGTIKSPRVSRCFS
jgi:hypothetical protein